MGAPVSSTTQVGMGIFDAFQEAFSTKKFDDRRATASHILVPTEEEALVVMKDISDGLAFDDAARQYSSCPSAKEGGSLGTFEPGQMVQAFDDVVFTEDTPIGQVIGPVMTQFGYHLIIVADRFENQVRSEGGGAF